MDDYLYFRLLFWFALVFGIAYLFLLIDLGIRISYRIDSISPKRIAQRLKKRVLPKNRKPGRMNKKIKSAV